MLDLSTAIPTGATAAPQQSAAYGLASSTAGSIFVVGSARQKVDRDHLPKPALWTVNTSGAMSITGAVLLPLPTYSNIPANDAPNEGLSGTYTNGVVRDIVAGDGGFWACGNVAAPRIYAEAYCWKLDANGNASTPIRVGIGAGQPLATTTVSRVRTLPIGANGAPQSVVIGSALGTDGKWKGWVYNLSTNAPISTDFGFSGETDAMAHDAAGIRYSNGTSLAYGMMVGGISASMSIFNDGTLPVSYPLRGIERRMLLVGATQPSLPDMGQVCAIQDDSAPVNAGAYDQLVSLSRNGQFRLARAGTQLVQLSVANQAHDVSIVSRNTRIRTRFEQKSADYTGSGLNPTEYIYYEGEVLPNQVNNATAAALLMSNALGCGAADDEPGLGNCHSATQAAFDLRDNGIRLPLSAASPGEILRSVRVYGTILMPNDYQYVQIASRTNDTRCSITPVLPAPTTIRYNPQVDLNDPTTTAWKDCYLDGSYPGSPHLHGFETDTNISYDHCGTCSNRVNTLSCGTT